MRTSLFSVLLLIVVLNPYFSFSQKRNSGIYFSYAEFKSNNPSIKIDSSAKLNYRFPKGLDNLKVVTKDSQAVSQMDGLTILKSNQKFIYKVKAGSAFAYSYNNVTYRYVTDTTLGWKIIDGYYKIENEGNLIIYSKSTTGYRGLSSTEYFYSLNLNSNLKPLQTKYLLKDFADNQVFCNNLSTNKQMSKSLTAKNKDGKFIIETLFDK